MEGQVGIFFMHERKIHYECTPVKDAEDYGHLKTHGTGHPEFWKRLQARGIVPREQEYDEVPRGRITYDTRERLFYVFLDRCIREQAWAVDEVLDAFDLQKMAVELLGRQPLPMPGLHVS
jgi:hypothetical protein